MQGNREGAASPERLSEFLMQTIFPGRPFVRRMYAKYSSVLNKDGRPTRALDFKLKQHHHVRLDKEFKDDCRTWLDFLNGDLAGVVSRPMVDILGMAVMSHQICFYSDVSTAKELGFGCILNNKWIQGFWGSQFATKENPSIEFLKLFALAAGLLTWETEVELINTRVIVFCNNQAVIHMVNDMTSTCEKCMKLIRLMVLSGLRCNRRVTAKFVPSKSNGLTDALSRG